MKKLYLILAILGFVLPTYFVLLESIEAGNILLYTDPMTTMNQMFANRISTIFSIDLLFAVLVFFIWTYSEREQIGTKKLGFVWGLTMLFGLASGFPLYLYFRE